MCTKGFLLLIVTVIVIGGSIGGAFAGGLALGRSQGGDSETAFLQGLGGGQFSSGPSPADANRAGALQVARR
ncbi:MAG: hypothetical protein O2913_07915 [Chloroflexi bacterium]|nr:hypothetical protein [Chloroflexota bacterium]